MRTCELVRIEGCGIPSRIEGGEIQRVRADLGLAIENSIHPVIVAAMIPDVLDVVVSTTASESKDQSTYLLRETPYDPRSASQKSNDEDRRRGHEEPLCPRERVIKPDLPRLAPRPLRNSEVPRNEDRIKDGQTPAVYLHPNRECGEGRDFPINNSARHGMDRSSDDWMRDCQ